MVATPLAYFARRKNMFPLGGERLTCLVVPSSETGGLARVQAPAVRFVHCSNHHLVWVEGHEMSRALLLN